MAATAERLPDEILLKCFQYNSLQEKIGKLPRVCRRWRRLCGDSNLWQVIEIPPKLAKNRLITKILKRCADEKTKVIRILSSTINVNANVLTKNTWDLVLTCAPNLVELYIQETNLHHLANIWRLPSSIERIYIRGCINYVHVYAMTSYINLQKLLDDCGSTHPKLHTIDSGHSPFFYNKTLNATGSCSGITSLGLSKYYRLTVADLVKMIQPFTNIEVLDLSGSTGPGSGYPIEQFKKLLLPLIHLKTLDISDNVLLSNADLNHAWSSLWSLNVAPLLSTVRVCLVRLCLGVDRRPHCGHGHRTMRNESKHWFNLDNPFSERSNLRIIGYKCKIADERDHDCEVDSLIPQPTTFISV